MKLKLIFALLRKKERAAEVAVQRCFIKNIFWKIVEILEFTENTYDGNIFRKKILHSRWLFSKFCVKFPRVTVT